MAKSPARPERDRKGRYKKSSRLPRFTGATRGKDSPHFFRRITAGSKVASAFYRYTTTAFSALKTWFNWRLVAILLIVAVLLLNLIRFGQNLYTSYQEAQAKQAQQQTLEAEIVKWEKIVKERSNYRDAYFELAVLTYRLNRIEEAKKYLSKVFELDPNFQPARDLQKILVY